MNSISTPEIKRLLVSHGFFVFARTLFQLFMTLYIWQLTSSLASVAIFHIIFVLAHCTFFTLCAPLVKKGHARPVRIIGVIGTGFVLLGIFLIGEKTANYLELIAFLYGSFNSLYWLTYHAYNFNLTHSGNRGNFTGFERALNISGNLIAPILGGFLITKNIFGLGYGNIFLLSMASLFACILIGNISAPVYNKRKFHLKETAREVIKIPDLRRIILAGTVQNIGQHGALRELIPIFLLITLGRELDVGVWITFFSAISIITALIIGKYLSYKYYKKSSVIAGGALSASLFTLIIWPTLPGYIIFGSLKELFLPILNIVRRVYYQNLLDHVPDHTSHRTEYIVIREWMNVGLGRIISFVPLLFISSFTSFNMFLLLICMSIATLMEPLFILRIKTDVSKW